MKCLDKSLNIYPIAIYTVTSFVIMMFVLLLVWSNNHRIISVNLSEDMTTTSITSELPFNVNVEQIALFFLIIISVSFMCTILLQLANKRKIISEIQNLSNEMLKKSISPINSNYSYTEFDNIKNAYNDKINQINEQTKKKDEYFNMTVHDLRSPIQAVKNNLSMLERFPEETAEILSSLKEEVYHLEQEVSRYLILEKIEYFEKPQMEFVDLNSFFEKFKKKYAIESHLVSIKSTGNYTQQIDIAMFEKVVMNLIQNAVEYSSDHKLEIDIESDYILFSNNVNQRVNKIFTNKRTVSSGNGLGTQIVSKYLELQNLYLEELNTDTKVNIKIKF